MFFINALLNDFGGMQVDIKYAYVLPFYLRIKKN